MWIRVCVFLFLLSLSLCQLCSDAGYKDYLARYPFKGGDSLDEYMLNHNNTYINNCYKLHSRKRRGVHSEETALLDWSDEELDSLGNISAKYSGNPNYNPEIEPNEKEKQFSVNKRSYIELSKYNDPKEKCSTSWATATIELAEAALDHKVHLSVRQLFDCLPEKEMINGCEGVHPKVLMEYLMEVGLVEDKEFQSCDSLKNVKHYYFSPIQPESPNAGGLMNLIAEENRPVFVMVAIDLKKLRFVKDMSSVREGMKCADYQPSLYGLVTGYHYDENIENSWWEITTYIIPGEMVIMRIPMSGNMENANYAGIAGYAYGIRRMEEMTEEPTTEPTTSEPPTSEGPTTSEPPTSEAPTTEPPLNCGDDDLIIDNNDDCELLFISNWTSIDVKSGMCNGDNGINGNMTISDYLCLERLVVGGDSLKDLESLTISNNPRLNQIVIEDGSDWDNGAFFNVKSVVIDNLPKLTSFNTGDYSFLETNSLNLTNLPKLTSFNTGDYSFPYTNSLNLTNLPKLTSFNTGDYSFYETNSLNLTNLPKLTLFNTGDYSFRNTNSLNLANLPKLTSFNTGESSFYSTNSLNLANLPNLISFNTGYESFYSTNSLNLTNLPKLTSFNTGYNSFRNTNSLNLTNLPKLTSFNTGYYSFYFTDRVKLEDLPNLISFNTGEYSFRNTNSLNLTNLPNLISFNTGDYSFRETNSLNLTNLPKLTSFNTGDYSFYSTTSLNLTNLPNLISFNTGYYSLIKVKSLVLKDIPSLQNLDLNCPFRNYNRDTKVVENASLFENCYCFKYDVVCSKDDFYNLQDAEGIVIGNECMNSETEIDFSILENVTVIDVGYNSLIKVNNLFLEDLPKLISFNTGESSFYFTDRVKLEDLPKLTSFNTGYNSFRETNSLNLTNLPKLTSFNTGDYSFYLTNSLNLTNLPKLTSFNTGYYSFRNTNSLNLTNLPKLTSFNTGYYSFYETNSLNLANLPNLITFSLGYDSFITTQTISLKNVPFSNGQYSIDSTSRTFQYITSDNQITSDDISSKLKNCILNNCS